MKRLTKKEQLIINEFVTVFNKYKFLGSTRISQLISNLFPICQTYSFNYQNQKQIK